MKEDIKEKPFNFITRACEDFHLLWEKGVQSLPGATCFYTSLFREYDLCLFSDSLLSDDSFIVTSREGTVLAIVPLYIFKDDNNDLHYRYGEGFLRAPLIATNNFKKVSTVVYDHIDQLAKNNNIKSHSVAIEPFELLDGRNYYNYLLDFNYQALSAGTSVINCSTEEVVLRQGIRKSYKPLINKALKSYGVTIVSASSFSTSLCEEYRRLHEKAAGRQTRSIQSFQLMYRMIKKDEAFLVLIKDSDQVFVGAYFFLKNGQYVFYGSAATDPDLNIQCGVGHLGLWSGIIHAGKNDCKYLDMGQVILPQSASKKEEMINFFKQGFGGTKVTMFRGIKFFN